MLETYFVKPTTVDRVRASWIGPQIEDYVVWLSEHGYGAKTVWHRVPLLVAFGEFAHERGARAVEGLPAHVDAYVAERVAQRRRGRRRGVMNDTAATKEVRGPEDQVFAGAPPGFEGTRRRRHD